MDLDITARLAENFHQNKNEHNWPGEVRLTEQMLVVLKSRLSGSPQLRRKKSKAAFLDLSYQSLQLYKKDLKFCSKFKSKILLILHSSFVKNMFC